jgi:peptidoglycan/LPS O-acetylase OafA/YrhL
VWLQRLGTISYSFYLWHLLVMFVTKRVTLRLLPDGAGTWAATLLFGLASLALSWWLAALSWRWVEQAFSRWLRQRLGLVRPRPAALAA